MLVQTPQHTRWPLNLKVIDLVVETSFGKHSYLQVEAGSGESIRDFLRDLRLLMKLGDAVLGLDADLSEAMIDSHRLFALRPSVAEVR